MIAKQVVHKRRRRKYVRKAEKLKVEHKEIRGYIEIDLVRLGLLKSRAQAEGVSIEQYIEEALTLRMAHRREIKLVEINPAPKMNFGKYRDTKVSDVPTGYLKWVLDECNYASEDLLDEIRQELSRREIGD